MIVIKYNTAVFTPAGWRPEEVTAVAEKLSDKRARVIKVLDVGGNGATGYASRTGAKRQRYDVGYFASLQVGAIKLLNFVTVEQSI